MKVFKTKQFDKNFQKYVRSDGDKEKFIQVLLILTDGRKLPKNEYHDHQLLHQRNGVRDFHLASDLVVVYYRIIEDRIEFLDVGPHSKVFKKFRKF